MLRSHHFCFCVLCALLGLALFLALVFMAPQSAHAQAPSGKVSFINDVAPILKERCFACHDAKKRKGKLDMTTFESFRKGGDKDDPVSPGKPDESLLLDLVKGPENTRMPPKENGDRLAKDKIETIEKWVAEGAKLDEGIAPKADLLRELRIRWKPPSPMASYHRPVTITALAFTPDNQKLVVGGNHELTVWDMKDGRLEKRISTRAERALAMLFLPDGKLAVAGSRPGQEGDVKVYDLAGGTPRMENGVAMLDGVHDTAVLVGKLLETDDSVNCLALSPDGSKLAAGGNDRIVNIWDLTAGYATPKIEQSIENHADWVLGVVFSPDGKHLLTASRDKTAKVWDLATKESVLTFPDHQAAVFGVAIKSDGKVGISVGEDKLVRFWNATGDPKQLGTAPGHTEPILRLLAHPKEPLLVTCSADKTVRIWDVNKRSNLRTLNGHTDHVFALAISPDGNLLASGSYNGEVKVWKIADGTVVKSFNASPGLQTAEKK